MQELIQLAVILFVVVFIANKLQKPLFEILEQYRKKKKEWDKNETSAKV